MYRLRRSPTVRPRRRSGGLAEVIRDDGSSPRIGPLKQRPDRVVDREIDHGRKGSLAAAEEDTDALDVRLGTDSAGARWLRSSRQQAAPPKS